MDSTIIPTQKRSLTNTQEKFLDVLFGEAKGNLKKAGELAGYSEHSYPKVVRNLKQEIISRAENYLATHSAKAATKMVDMLDEDGTTPLLLACKGGHLENQLSVPTIFYWTVGGYSTAP